MANAPGSVSAADDQSLADGLPAPGSVAIFDLDRTLIPGSSLMALARELARRGVVRRRGVLRHASRSVVFTRRGLGDGAVESIRTAALDALSGHAESDVAPIAKDVGHELASRIYSGARRLLELHQTAGDFCVLLSASPQDLVEVVAADLGAHRAIGTRGEVVDGRFTGRLDGPFCYGVGKITRLHHELGDVDLTAAHAYADSMSDVPLLASCGRPVAVNPDRRLRAVARVNGWPVIHLN